MKGILVAIVGVIAAVVIFVIVVAFSVISLRNNLALQQEDIETQWAKVETQYQRRYDLIPNLVASVKGYMEQEQEIFGDIADARTQYGSAKTPDAQLEAANELESALGRLLVIMEDYPELNSDETVIALMVELEGTENRISVERNRYNDLVNDYNKTIVVFPNNLINDWLLHYEEKDLFEAAEGTDVVPTVDLDVSGDEEAEEEIEETEEME